MKNIKSNELERINISVIGLSGSERDKGVKGVGKSCLCNRLAQPNYYKPKHSSVVTSIDFYGSESNNSQLLFWGCVERDFRGKCYRFQFIEQTVMLDDISHCALSKKEEYVKRATSIEIIGTKNVHAMGPSQSILPSLCGKTPIHIFILVYDVSNVEGRNPNVQDIMFKQLFDNVIQTKRPIIVVTTKHDVVSPQVYERLTTMLDKRPYNRYPVVETSASIGINVDQIYDMTVQLCDGTSKTLRQKVLNYQEAFNTHQSRLEQCRKELKQVALEVMDSDRWHASWNELKHLDSVESWIKRLGAVLVQTTFDDVRMDVRLKRRVSNQCKHKECLLSLLSRSHHLFPEKYSDMSSVIQGLLTDLEFMTHFIDFNRDAEYFDFQKNKDLLPRYILDATNENNLIHVVKEYMDQVTLEEQLFQRLIIDGPGNFRKSKKEIGEDLRQFMKHFIPEKIISNVFDKFQQHYLKIIESQFLETLHQYQNLFHSVGKHSSIDALPNKSPRLNGISRNKSSHDMQLDSDAFLTNMAKEINSKINFALLPVSEDEHRVREVWIVSYLRFLLSRNELQCIYHIVTNSPCNATLICDAGLNIGIAMEPDSCYAHMSYIYVIGKSGMRKQLTDIILSTQNNYTLELCKVHSTKYEMKLLDSSDAVKDVVSELIERGDKCSSVCVLICADDAHLQSKDIDRISHLPQSSSFRLAKYLVYSVCEEMVKVTPFDDCILYEDDPEADCIHISSLMSDCKRLLEPSIIWVVTVCGDLYDYDGLLATITGVLKLYSNPRRAKTDAVTLSGCFTSKDIGGRNYRLCFITYHQAMKSLSQPSCPAHIDGLILVSSLDRVASLDTCLHIGKYLPPDTRAICHCLLLGVIGHSDALCAEASAKSAKYAMMASFVSADNLKKASIDIDAQNQVIDFLTDVFKGSPVADSVESSSINTSSLKSRCGTMTGDSTKVTNQYVCKTCGQCRSHENINNNFRMTDSTHDNIFDSTLYAPILGETNSELFDNCHPEFKFHETQDACPKCTLINCTIHQPHDSTGQPTHRFRTRMRSQSGPDLRNSFESKDSSLTKSDSSSTYCSTCGAKMAYNNDVFDSRKSLFHKSSGDKDSPSKKLSTRLQDMFSPSKRFNESQNHEGRKSFIRNSSKRRK